MKKINLIIANPPYSIGNKIISEVIKHLTDDGKAVVIQPLSQYKKQKLFENAETFELADPKIFEDASITRNLCICSLKKESTNKYTWKALLMDSCDQSLRKFYDWNIENTRNLVITQTVYQPPTKFNIDTDVIESGRYVGLEHGAGYHAKNCCAYSFNMLNTVNPSNWIKNIAFIRFPSKHAKQNYCKYIYNYTTNKYDCLESKALCGLHITTAAQEYSFFIPQIDWETIDQHPLWNTDIDGAVLDVMGLKWNVDKTIIIDK